MGQLKPDRAVIGRFLSAILRSHIHIVAIIPDGRVTAKWFGEDAKGAAVWASDQNAQGAGVYFSVNVVRAGLNKKASKQEILAARFVHVDLDPPFDRDRLMLQLTTQAYPPAFIIDSGNGLQAFWRLRDSAPDLDAVETCNRQAAASFGGDRCFNIDRVMRLPGTVNFPNRSKKLKGCVPRLSNILEDDWGDSVPLHKLLVSLRPVSNEPETMMGQVAERRGWDVSRSGEAFRLASKVRGEHGTFNDFRMQLGGSSRLVDWAEDERQVLRAWTRSESPAAKCFLRLSATGKPLSNLANVLAMLRNTTELTYLVAYDEMAREIVLTSPIPFHADLDERAFHARRPLADDDATRLQEYLQAAGLTHVSKETVQNALDVLARENSFHPVRDYLRSLKWDGVRRISTWLIQYCGAEDSEYVRQVGRMFLIGMMARVRSPGCKVDHMPILEGAQGGGKSTVCAILGGEWFSDSLPELRSHKDVSQHLRGKWLVEVGELHAMSNAENALLKSFLARTEERYRPAYGRREVTEPRQSVFIGTTNSDSYLKDETGGRRFWPVKVGDVLDTVALKRDRDQLLAEAWQAGCDGEPHWPDRDFEDRYARLQQNSRFEVDAWESVIEEFLDLEERVTIQGIAQSALRIELAALDRPKQARIVKILKRLKWTRGRTSKARHWERQ